MTDRPRRHRRALTLGLTALVVLAVAGAIWAWTQRDRVDVGLVHGDRDVYGTTNLSSSVELPGATLSLSAQIGQEAKKDGGKDAVRAPRGGRLVELSWQLQAERPGVGDQTVPEPPRGVAVWIRSGGREIQVASDAGRDGQVDTSTATAGLERRHEVVALPGESGSVEVVVAFAGRRQSVSLSTGERAVGSFAGLYRQSPVPFGRGRVSAEQTRADGLRWTTESGVTPTRTPYLPERGWARPGKEWLVLDTFMTVKYVERELGDDREWYDDVPEAPVRSTITVDGRPPAAPGERVPGSSVYGRGATAQTRGAVFEVGASDPARVRLGVSAAFADESDRRTTVTTSVEHTLPAQTLVAPEQVR